MRKLFCALGILVWAASFSPAFAQDDAGERIANFYALIQLRDGRVLEITEHITYDFGDSERHGIYRDLPLVYNGGNDRLSIEDVKVADENSVLQPFEISKNGGYLRIRIGDPDILVTGSKTYLINYLADGAVQWGDDSDMVIWNVTGNGWEVPIDSASAEFQIGGPDAVYECYQGPYGSIEPCVMEPPSGNVGHVFRATGPLGPGEGLTISATLPKGSLIPPTPFEKFLEFLFVYWPLALPAATFIFLFRRWWRSGRDPKGRGTIIPQYEPPAGLSPIETGSLLTGSVQSSYISAQIIFLATRGFLKITPIGRDSGKPDDYMLEKTKDANEKDAALDILLMSALFSTPAPAVKLSELKNKFAKSLEGIKGGVWDSLLQKGYYDRDPRKVWATYVVPAFLFIFLSVFLFNQWPLLLVSCIASAVLVGMFGWIMPKVTLKGATDKEHISGFRDYLDIVEKDRLSFHNAPEKRPELFEKFLPYAMVLGVINAWAKEFEDIYLEPPRWYGGSAHGPFLAAVIAQDMSRFSNVVASNALASGNGGQSGGGGFSGGGAGGGGGGSW